jgi:uncharacterized membrane protein
MLVILECTSLVIYGVLIVLCFVFGLARGKKVRKVLAHFVFFFLLYMMMLCWVGMTSAWFVDGIDIVRFSKNIAFSLLCMLVVTNIVNKFSAYTLIHLVNFTFAYYAMYNAFILDHYGERLTWLEICGVVSACRLAYLVKEILDGKNYNPIIAKTVVTLNIIYDVTFFVVFVMSPYFQSLISLYTMNVVMSIFDLSIIPLCSLIIVHYNWISIAHSDVDKNAETVSLTNIQREVEEAFLRGELSHEDIMRKHHTYT